MSRPRLLDLYCYAGGAAVGYHRAGFDVTGVDCDPQPRYPFPLVVSDALEFLAAHGHEYDAIHASPPCQRYTNGAKQKGTAEEWPDLIAPTRDLLLKSGKPFILENVETARQYLRRPTLLCGTMFGLGVFRHRLFEASFHLLAPYHEWPHAGHVGDGRYFTVTGHTGGSSKRDGWKGGSAEDWKAAMGIDWMTVHEMAEALPPAYTHFLGLQLLREVRGEPSLLPAVSA